MKKGISPVVAVVLLIAIAVIAAVGVWYWVGGLASKPGGVDTAQTGFTVEGCGNNTILVRNTGATAISKGATLYGPDNNKVGYVAFNESHGDFESPLEADGVGYVPVMNTTGSQMALESAKTYTIIEGELPTVQFTC